VTRRRGRACLVAVVVALCGLAAACGDGPSSHQGSDAAARLPLDRAWLVGTHNSYWVDRGAPNDLFASGVQENLLDQLLADHVRAIELDVHPDHRTAHRYRVYHTVPGNSLCDDFADCLRPLRILQYALPRHEAVHVIIELKEFTASNFDPDHSVEDFEGIIESELGPWMIRPRDLLARCAARAGDPEPEFLDCLERGGWPTLAEGRGRFVASVLANFDDLGPTAKGTVDWATFALHGSLFDRSAFAMASSWKLDWDTLPAKIQQDLSREALAQARRRSAFLQVEDTADPNLAPFLRRRGLVRIDGAFSVEDQQARTALGAQILQTDTPWLQLDDRGPAQPLRPLGAAPDGADVVEPGERLLLSAAQAPAPQATFGEVFAWRSAAAPAATWWETVPSVGAASDGLACLAAARTAAEDSTASYLLCRGKLHASRSRGITGGSGGADTEKIRLRARVCRAGACTWSLLALDATEARAAAIALRFAADGQPGCVQPFVAGDLDVSGQPAWRPAAAAECFPEALAAQGLAVLGDPDAAAPAMPAVTTRSALFVRTRVRTSDGLRTVGEPDLHGADDATRP
jgi:hypothetical protein